MDVGGKLLYGLCEVAYVFSRLTQKMEGKAQSAARAYSRQGADCLNRFTQNL